MRWLAAIGLVGCVHRGPDPRDTIRARSELYVELVRRMDVDAIADLFDEHGEIDTVHGRDAIRAFLKTFGGFHVDSYDAVVESVDVRGADGTTTGTYRQQVTTPDGHAIEVRGRFTADWVREKDGAWRIHRMETTTDP